MSFSEDNDVEALARLERIRARQKERRQRVEAADAAYREALGVKSIREAKDIGACDSHAGRRNWGKARILWHESGA
jgi:predicted NAD-dependent protein-ADP-ribosyltransferase YbiA (DUF1768 family)